MIYIPLLVLLELFVGEEAARGNQEAHLVAGDQLGLQLDDLAEVLGGAGALVDGGDDLVDSGERFGHRLLVGVVGWGILEDLPDQQWVLADALGGLDEVGDELEALRLGVVELVVEKLGERGVLLGRVLEELKRGELAVAIEGVDFEDVRELDEGRGEGAVGCWGSGFRE